MMGLLEFIEYIIVVFIGAIIGSFLLFLYENLGLIFPKLGERMHELVMILEALFALFIGALIGDSPFYFLLLWQKYKRLDDD